MRARSLAAVLVGLTLLAGCARVHHRVVTETLPPITDSPSPLPARTILHAFRTYDAGQTASLQAQRGVSLSITVDRPRASTTRLSSSYGYPPQHGHYLTFRIHVRNTGSQPVEIGPRNFVLLIRGQGTVTSYDGNSPYSGASRQLNTTELEPGDHETAPLTFDVRRTHGRLDFRPAHTTALRWRF